MKGKEINLRLTDDGMKGLLADLKEVKNPYPSTRFAIALIELILES